MAAPTYTTDLTTISTAEAITNFSEPTGSTQGGTPTRETDFFIQGSFCVSKTFNATGVGGLAYTNASNLTIPTNGAVYTWIYFAAPNALAAKASGGMQILAGSTVANYKRFYVSGNDTYSYGGWVNFPVNPSITASATQGTPSGNWATFGYAANVTNAIQKGNPMAIDAIRYGRGTLQAVNGEVSNYANFAGAAAQNDSSSNRWGILSLVDGVYKLQGHLLLGTSGTAVNFIDENKSIFIQNTEFVTDLFNLIEIRNASSVVNLNSISITSLGTVSRGNFEVTDNATVNITGCSFTGLGFFSTKPNTTIESSIFRRCQTLTSDGSEINNCEIIHHNPTTGISTNDPSKITNCTFTSTGGSGHGVVITQPGTYDFIGNTFTGYGNNATIFAAILNDSGGTVTLNVLGGGNRPTVRNNTGAATNVNLIYQLGLTGLKTDSEVRIYLGTDPSTSTEIAGTESSGTTFSFYHSYPTQDGYIQIFHVDYQPILLPITFGDADTSIPIQQVIDRQYSRGTVFTP